MTTFAGIIQFDGQAVAEERIERLSLALEMYRPEARRTWRRDQAALACGLRRFSPEDAFDRQPLSIARDHPVLVFSGRLDNRDELAQALGIAPVQLRGMADSALVLAAHATWGEDCPRHLVGDFAFAVWSPGGERLFLARDPLGKRPLHWHLGAGFFAFASAAQTLHALPEITQTLDEDWLADYLALLPSAEERCAFKDISRLQPGHSLMFERGQVRVSRHYHFDAERRIDFVRDEEYVEAFREQVETAVGRQLRAQGPVGAYLSSGFDSSVVCAVAATQLASRGEGLLAFTHVPRAGFDGPAPRGRHGDEGPAAAALAARHANIDHVLVRKGASPLAQLESHPLVSGRPILNPYNALWMNAIRDEAAARGVRVLLTGNWGNQGLSYHGLGLLAELMRQGKWPSWFREVSGLRRQSRMRWLGVASQSLGPFLPEWLWALVKPDRRGEFSGLFAYSSLRPEVARSLDIQGRGVERGHHIGYRPTLSGRVRRFQNGLRFDRGEDYLAALAQAGVEERSPAGDLRLLEFCLAVPEEQFLRNGQMRWLLRRAYGDRLPPEILDARTKGQQSADWYEGASRERPAMLAELERLAASPTAARLLDLEGLRRDLDNWPTDGWAQWEVIATYKLKLLRGLSVGVFIRKLEGGNE